LLELLAKIDVFPSPIPGTGVVNVRAKFCRWLQAKWLRRFSSERALLGLSVKLLRVTGKKPGGRQGSVKEFKAKIALYPPQLKR